jgi:hypothetical protein
MAPGPFKNSLQGMVALQKLRCYNWIMNNLIQALTDEQLLSRLKSAVSREREATAHLIALLVEMDRRRLYLAEGYSSLFVYCTRCLHLSEHAAYGRIEVARAARRFPIVLELLADGSITLTTVSLLASHLTEENQRALLEAARHKSKREVEQQAAALAPKPDVRSAIRRLPQPTSIAPVLTVASSDPNNVAHAMDRTDPPTLPAVRRTPPVIVPLHRSGTRCSSRSGAIRTTSSDESRIC